MFSTQIQLVASLVVGILVLDVVTYSQGQSADAPKPSGEQKAQPAKVNLGTMLEPPQFGLLSDRSSSYGSGGTDQGQAVLLVENNELKRQIQDLRKQKTHDALVNGLCSIAIVVILSVWVRHGIFRRLRDTRNRANNWPHLALVGGFFTPIVAVVFGMNTVEITTFVSLMVVGPLLTSLIFSYGRQKENAPGG